MWTAENRSRYDRRKLRYPSDLTDAEWALVAPLIRPAKRGGNKRTVNVREVMNGLMYMDVAPNSLPPNRRAIGPPRGDAVLEAPGAAQRARQEQPDGHQACEQQNGSHHLPQRAG